MLIMLRATEERLKAAAQRLSQLLVLKDENAQKYVEAIVPILSMWTGETVSRSNLFL